jgi:Ca-activated chloride channel family protein
MSREQLQQVVEAWDPAGDADLPDEVAIALDQDPEFRAWFDQRFAKWEPTVEQPAPTGLAERVIPGLEARSPGAGSEGSRSSRRGLWIALGLGGTSALAAAAAMVVVVGVAATAPLGVSTDVERHEGVAPSAGSRTQALDTGDEKPLVIKERPRAAKPKPAEPGAAEPLQIIRGGKKDVTKVGADGTLAWQTEPPSPKEDVPKLVANGFEDVATDAQSTFSVDVDAGSYTSARKSLRSGYLPSQSAVRVEEFVNYFPYEYAPPSDGPFAVHVEGAPAPWSADTQLVRIGLQGKKVAADQRSATHLTFLVDVSGSMNADDKLPLVQKSLKMLVSELRDGDTVALVVYAGKSGVVLEPTPVSDAGTITKAIDRLTAGGSTAMGEGIQLAYALAEQSYEQGAVNRVIIASDGDANVGVTDTAALSKLIEGYADKGITLTTLGFGTGNYRDSRMEQLANDGDGNYYYVDTDAEARRVLVDRMTSTLEVIARDVKIQVDWNAGAVKRYRLLGYENRAIADRDFTNDKVDAGEIGAGHQVTAIYEVELQDQPVGDLFVLKLRSKAPGPEAPSVEQKWRFGRAALRSSLSETTADFRVALAAATFAERLRGSEYAPGFGYDDISALLAGAKRPEYAEDAELAELVATAARLSP